jgi:hypothetical protein
MATPTPLPAAFVAGQVLTAAQQNALRGAFRVLQVVSTAKTDTFTTASTSYTDVTGLSVSITPSSTDSKVLVFVTCNASNTNATGTKYTYWQLLRGATAIFIGDTAGSRTRSTWGTEVAPGVVYPSNAVFLDSPATTSATTYKLQMRCNGDTAVLNRNGVDTDNALYPRTASSITVMEISA